MIQNLLTNYYEVVSIVLFAVGFSTLLLHRNVVKKVIGLNVMDTGVCLFLAVKGYVDGRAAPIIVNGVLDAEAYINPIPAGLILTGIVISVSVTAFSLALIVSLYKRYDTLDINEMIRLAAKEAENE